MSRKGEIASTPIPGTKQSVEIQRFVSSSNKSRAQSRANRLALVLEFKNSIKQAVSFKPAKLYSAKGDLTKEWYVEYFFQVPGDFLKYKRFKVRLDINRQKTLADRLNYGNELVKFMNDKLRNGFNPFLAFQLKDPQSSLTILKQLEYILNELCDGETKSAKHTFNSHYNRFEKYVEESGLTDMSLAYFGKDHCEGYKTWMKKKDLSRKTINSSLSYMSRFFRMAIKKDWLVDNHMKNVEQIKEREYRTDTTKRERFDPINGNEMDLIFKSLREKKEHSFIAFLAMIYYAWIRPVEISRLKIGDIDLKRSIIKLKKNDTKNNMGAHVQIVPPLLSILKKIDFSKYSSNDYLFSKNNLLPGPEAVSKNYCGEKWKSLVKVALKIDKDMYALKHTGNIEYLLNNKGNTDLKWQQSQNRHKTSSMTDLYNRKLGAYFIEVGELKYRHFE